MEACWGQAYFFLYNPIKYRYPDKNFKNSLVPESSGGGSGMKLNLKSGIIDDSSRSE
jgi:hypothetical protein